MRVQFKRTTDAKFFILEIESQKNTFPDSAKTEGEYTEEKEDSDTMFFFNFTT